MKKIFIILGAVAFVLLSGCRKEEFAKEKFSGEQTVKAAFAINAVLEEAAPDAKTTIGKIDDKQYAFWSKTDAVRTFDENGVYATMEIEADDDFEPSTTATFIAKEVHKDFISPLYSIYPESLGATYDKDTKLISFNLPAAQSYKENSFADNTNVAVSEIKKVDGKSKATFKNVCGYLKLQLKGYGTVTRITLEGKKGEKLNGEFTVDPKAENPVAVASGDPDAQEKILTLNVENGVPLDPVVPKIFLFVVPVGSFGNGTDGGFKATVCYQKFDSNVMETSKSNEIFRSAICSMPAKEVVLLPEEYEHLEYLESNRNRIVKGPDIVAHDYTIEFPFSINPSTATNFIFGAAIDRGDTSTKEFCETLLTAPTSTRTLTSIAGMQGVGHKSISLEPGQESVWRKSIINKKYDAAKPGVAGHYCYIDGTCLGNDTYSSLKISQPYLFARNENWRAGDESRPNYGTIPYTGDCKIGSVKYYPYGDVNEEADYYLIPAMNRSTGERGYYDVVNNKLYPFTYIVKSGSTYIESKYEYESVPYLESNQSKPTYIVVPGVDFQNTTIETEFMIPGEPYIPNRNTGILGCCKKVEGGNPIYQVIFRKIETEHDVTYKIQAFSGRGGDGIAENETNYGHWQTASVNKKDANGNHTSIVDGVSNTIQNPIPLTDELYIFGRKDGIQDKIDNMYFIGRIKYVKMYPFGSTEASCIHYLVPMRRIKGSEKKLGLFDQVTGEFYTSAGTGDFTTESN